MLPAVTVTAVRLREGHSVKQVEVDELGGRDGRRSVFGQRYSAAIRVGVFTSRTFTSPDRPGTIGMVAFISFTIWHLGRR